MNLVILLFAGLSDYDILYTCNISRRDLPLVMCIGVIGYAMSIWAQFLGTKHTSAQMGAMITSATPTFIVVFARVLLGERVTRRKALSVGLATVGVFMIVGILLMKNLIVNVITQ